MKRDAWHRIFLSFPPSCFECHTKIVRPGALPGAGWIAELGDFCTSLGDLLCGLCPQTLTCSCMFFFFFCRGGLKGIIYLRPFNLQQGTCQPRQFLTKSSFQTSSQSFSFKRKDFFGVGIVRAAYVCLSRLCTALEFQKSLQWLFLSGGFSFSKVFFPENLPFG